MATFGLAGAPGVRPASAQPAESRSPVLRAAHEHWLRGRYAEALDAYQLLSGEHPADAALGVARCRRSLGEQDAARPALERAATDHPQVADLQAELALWAYERGDIAEAQLRAQAARHLNDDHFAARWVEARIAQQAGHLDQAEQAYRWFVEFHNRSQPDDCESLLWIGRAAAEHARWRRLPDQFQFLVGKLYPQAAKLDPRDWRPHLEAGRLYLEKYNEADAARKFAAALALNPRSAEVHAALAELALQSYDLDGARTHLDRAADINPKLIAIHQLQADWHLANFQIVEAQQELEHARKSNPVDEATLGRLAAVYALSDGWHPDDRSSRLGTLIDEVIGRNPRCGEFYYVLGTRLEERRRFPAAETAFREALARMPELVGPQAALGLMAMRLGREDEARQRLAEALKSDPFHVRASNMMKVLEVLDGYATLETEHFVLRYDAAVDTLLAEAAAKFLETTHRDLCQELGYEPTGKTLFEIFNSARNTGGHGWFSARMVGLPYVGTVGACAGTMVAMASPNDSGPRAVAQFNWARVLRHEYVHVINLQQTDFHIPHWFTEGLAVRLEGYPRPAAWNRQLAERVPKRELFNLQTINLGFIRPQSSRDWELAYCQAELYAEYFVERFGPDALTRLLDAFRSTSDTQAALRTAFDADTTEIERGYLEMLDRIVAELPPSEPSRPSTEQLVRQVRTEPDNLDALADLARAEVARRPSAARRLIEHVLRRQPDHPQGRLALAELSLREGDFKAAESALEVPLEENAPRAEVLGLAAALRHKAGDLEAAERLYRLGTRRFPGDSKWLAGLAEVLRTEGKRRELVEVLAQIAPLDPDDLAIRRELAGLHLALHEPVEAEHWAQEALYVDVLDAECHRLRGEALAVLGRTTEATEELGTAAAILRERADRLKP